MEYSSAAQEVRDSEAPGEEVTDQLVHPQLLTF